MSIGSTVLFPYQSFLDVDGQPLDDGYVWVGQQGFNPQTAPKTVYWDAALTIPAAQPLRTRGGYLSNAGTPGNIYTGGPYSLAVQNKRGTQILQVLDSEAATGDGCGMGCPLDYGADPTGANDSTAAFVAALDQYNSIGLFYPGTYRIDGTIVLGENATMFLGQDVKLLRKSLANGGTASTAPILHIKGGDTDFTGARVDGGIYESQNASPTGVVVMGHADTTTSDYNSRRSFFTNFQIYGQSQSPIPLGNVGLYMPSSQPTLGDNYSSYFHHVGPGSILTCDIGVYCTNVCNAFNFFDIQFRNIRSYGYKWEGVYNCKVFGGFMDTSENGVIGIAMLDSTLATPPHETELCEVYGYGVEPGGILSQGLYMDTNCTRNKVYMVANTGGGSTILNTNNDINTGFQLTFRGGAFLGGSFTDNFTVAPSANPTRIGQTQTKNYTGTVTEGAMVAAATVTMASVRYGCTIQCTLSARSPSGLRGGGAVATYVLNRDDDGAADTTKVTTLQVLPSVSTSNLGVTFAAASVAGNVLSINVYGYNNGGSSTYNYDLEVKVTVENFAAVTLS